MQTFKRNIAFGEITLRVYGWQALASHAGALDFAVAASCLKHTVPGDFSRYTPDEIHALMKGGAESVVR